MKTATTPWAAQIQWEEKNIGGYRRIMPSPGEPDKYTTFFILQNQASVYSDTAASKRREEYAKQLRKELSERVSYPLPLPNHKIGIMKSIVEEEEKCKRKKNKPCAQSKDGFLSESISENEERERHHLMSQRDFLVKSCGLVHNVRIRFVRWERGHSSIVV